MGRGPRINRTIIIIIIEDPQGRSTAARRFWSSGGLRSVRNLAALRCEVGCSSVVVGNVLVLGFVLGKISAVLSKISAILGLGRLVAFWGVLDQLSVDLEAA